MWAEEFGNEKKSNQDEEEGFDDFQDGWASGWD